MDSKRTVKENRHQTSGERANIQRRPPPPPKKVCISLSDKLFLIDLINLNVWFKKIYFQLLVILL